MASVWDDAGVWLYQSFEKRKVWLYLSPIFATLAFSIALALRYGVPIGYDVHFHKAITEVWASGGNGMMADFVLRINSLPYPPLLHVLMLPSVWLGDGWLLLMQMLLPTFAVMAVMKYHWLEDRHLSLLAGALVLGSFAFMDRAIQINPQALDYIFLSLGLYYYKQKFDVGLSICTILMVYTHSFFAIALAGLWILQVLRDRTSLGLVFVTLAATAPVWMLSLPYLIGHPFASGFENAQEAAFWENPLSFTVGYQRLLVLGYPLAVKYWRQHSGMVITILSLAPFLWLQADRFLGLSTVPLTLLLVEVYKQESYKVRELMQWITVLAAVFMYFGLVLWLALDYYSVIYTPAYFNGG